MALRVGYHQLPRLLHLLGEEIAQLSAIRRVLAVEDAVTQILHLRPWPEAQCRRRLKKMQRFPADLWRVLLERGQVVKYPDRAAVSGQHQIVVALLLGEIVD